MSTQTQQAQSTPTPPATKPRKPGHYRGRMAVAVATITAGAGLTALVLGVSAGSETQAPPNPGVPSVVVDPSTREGLDNLTKGHAAARQKQIDQQLSSSLEERTYAEQWAEAHSQSLR